MTILGFDSFWFEDISIYVWVADLVCFVSYLLVFSDGG